MFFSVNRFYSNIFFLQVEIGTMVELHLQKTPFYGVVKWIGNLPHCKALVKMAGIELVSNINE